MFETWRKNIRQNVELVRAGRGPAFASVVSGSEYDRDYWLGHFQEVRGETFNGAADLPVFSVWERHPKGNFLGTLNAWSQVKSEGGGALPSDGVGLMSMVFGEGRRLSPFTQAMGNRKPAFLTPLRSRAAGRYLNTADISNLYSANWVSGLREGGLRGLLVKWGDEAVIPGLAWEAGAFDFRDFDAVRFVWETDPTPTLAREKDWFVIEKESGEVKHVLARQEIDSLRGRLARWDGGSYAYGVNLGSLALTYDFLNVALEVMREDVSAPGLSADWDPYVWLALLCEGEAEWAAEREHEGRIGKSGIRALEARYPDFFFKMRALRGALERAKGRPPRVGAVNFGAAFWLDIGLHVTLRRCLEALGGEDDEAWAMREAFGIPHARDAKGNIVVGSEVPRSADIRNSVVIDSVILDPASVIHGGVVVGGRHRLLMAPHGGSALFCAADSVEFGGPRGVAYMSSGPKVEVPEGGRHATVLLPGGARDFVSSEDIWDYGGANYTEPVFGNPMSFREAGAIMSKVDGRELEARWQRTRDGWLA